MAVALDQGQLSEPLEGNQGVYMIEVTQRSEATVPEDITADQRRLKNTMQSRFGQGLLEEMKGGVEIKDERYKFY